MTALTVRLPNSIHQKIKELAERMETHEVRVKVHLANELRSLTIVGKNIPIFRYDTAPSGHDNNSTKLHKIGK